MFVVLIDWKMFISESYKITLPTMFWPWDVWHLIHHMLFACLVHPFVWLFIAIHTVQCDLFSTYLLVRWDAHFLSHFTIWIDDCLNRGMKWQQFRIIVNWMEKKKVILKRVFQQLFSCSNTIHIWIWVNLFD